MCGNGRYMTTKEAAEYTGYSLVHFKRLVHEGVIPYTKPRGRYYFSVCDLESFIKNEL